MTRFRLLSLNVHFSSAAVLRPRSQHTSSRVASASGKSHFCRAPTRRRTFLGRPARSGWLLGRDATPGPRGNFKDVHRRKLSGKFSPQVFQKRSVCLTRPAFLTDQNKPPPCHWAGAASSRSERGSSRMYQGAAPSRPEIQNDGICPLNLFECRSSATLCQERSHPLFFKRLWENASKF